MQAISRSLVAAIRFTTRWWPFEKGKEVPAYMGAVAARFGVLRPVWREFQPGLRMQLDFRDMIHQTILLADLWDPLLTRLVNEHLQPGDVFVDVGAHSGYFTLLASRRVGTAGAVLAIEPSPAVATQLRSNVRASECSNVRIEEVACSDLPGEAVLHVHAGGNSGMTSLASSNAGAGPTVAVQCASLDSLYRKHNLGRVRLMKIDVEGAELLVLRGAAEMIRQAKPLIVIELEPHLLAGFGFEMKDVVEWMGKLNYRVTPMDEHANYLCHPI